MMWNNNPSKTTCRKYNSIVWPQLPDDAVPLTAPSQDITNPYQDFPHSFYNVGWYCLHFSLLCLDTSQEEKVRENDFISEGLKSISAEKAQGQTCGSE